MTPQQRADAAEAAVPVASDLICRVRDGDAEGIARLATACGWDTDTAALIIVLAAMVSDASPVGDLLAWTEGSEPVTGWRQDFLPLADCRCADLEPCGTYAAARRHQRHHEPLDPACERAMSKKRAAYGRNRRARRAQDSRQQGEAA